MTTHQPLHSDSEYDMPSAEALLAGTLALMTGYAQSACPRQRCLMSAKIVSNLSEMAQHPSFSTQFQAVTDRIRPLWSVLAQAHDTCTAGSGPTPREPQTLWHAVAPGVQ